jgi:ferrochelatase
LAEGLQETLGAEWLIEAGMRFSEPTIGEAVERLLARGAERLLGLILSPQYSPLLMGGYQQALEAAARRTPSRMIEAWHLNPAFVDVLASRVRGALAGFPDGIRAQVPVLLSAHSLPRRVVDREPGYVAQLEETAQAIATAAELDPRRWWFCYQSAGHTPEEWLKPDLLDLLPELAAAGHRHVVVAPVQFVADHLETLYDIDIAGREQAEQAGFESFRRIDAPNDSRDFVAALASVARGEVVAWDAPRPGPPRMVAWTPA